MFEALSGWECNDFSPERDSQLDCWHGNHLLLKMLMLDFKDSDFIGLGLPIWDFKSFPGDYVMHSWVWDHCLRAS